MKWLINLLPLVFSQQSFYDFSAQDIDGRIVPLKEFRGKIGLVVNVASECGYTDTEYENLNELYNQFARSGKFEIFAFPCNQFGQQEPGSNAEIRDFVRKEKRVEFKVFSKVLVRYEAENKRVHPAWNWLVERSKEQPRWNFTKYLIDENGLLISHHAHDIPAIELRGRIKDLITKLQMKEDL